MKESRTTERELTEARSQRALTSNQKLQRYTIDCSRPDVLVESETGYLVRYIHVTDEIERLQRELDQTEADALEVQAREESK